MVDFDNAGGVKQPNPSPMQAGQHGGLPPNRAGGITGINNDAMMFVHNLLGAMVQRQASDLFLTVGFPPACKIHGVMSPLTNTILTDHHLMELSRAIMNDRQRSEFEATHECNFALAVNNIGRFRVNAFKQQGRIGLVMRKINTTIPRFDMLSLPKVLQEIAMTKRGMVIFVGATGSGKSTSLAALVDYRNENSAGHIITIEDPIEYVHEHKKCILTQREVGNDTDNWFSALKNTLRQAPDVILIGEVRERETMEYAINFAETGHLCLTTLHANNANQALDRIINFFPEEKRQQLLMDLSLNLKAVISQRLIPRIDGKGRVPAVEVMINTPYIADLIFKGEVPKIKEAIKSSTNLGMQTFDQALFDLHENGLISHEEALRNADSINDLRLQIKLKSKRVHHNTDGAKNLAVMEG